jgi:hypothetical protein
MGDTLGRRKIFGCLLDQAFAHMDFDDTFRAWVAGTVEKGVPSSVKALSFNLYEPAGEPGVRFGVELVGAQRFSATDPDWATEEVWEADPRGISIPASYSGATWEECLEAIKALVLRLLAGDDKVARAFKATRGVGVGFVDGDLEVVWRRKTRRSPTTCSS